MRNGAGKFLQEEQRHGDLTTPSYRFSSTLNPRVVETGSTLPHRAAEWQLFNSNKGYNAVPISYRVKFIQGKQEYNVAAEGDQKMDVTNRQPRNCLINVNLHHDDLLPVTPAGSVSKFLELYTAIRYALLLPKCPKRLKAQYEFPTRSKIIKVW